MKRSERRQSAFGAAWRQVAHLICEALGVAVPAGLTCRWGDPATPTRAATTDAVTKLVVAEVLPADSDVVLEQLGFDPATISRIRGHREAQAGERALATLVEATRGASGQAAFLASKVDTGSSL